jgi:hypothetical protein
MSVNGKDQDCRYVSERSTQLGRRPPVREPPPLSAEESASQIAHVI